MSKRMKPQEVYSPEFVRYSVQAVREDPQGFLRMVRKHCKTVTVEQAKAAMRAWGIRV